MGGIRDWAARRVCAALRNRPPDLIVGPANTPSMFRWRLFVFGRRARWSLCNVYAHIIMRGDDDGALHDHPWPSVSLVLAGGYSEQVLLRGRWLQLRSHKAPAIIFRRAGFTHRIAGTARGEPCLTLFIAGPAVNRWGFFYPREATKVPPRIHCLRKHGLQPLICRSLTTMPPPAEPGGIVRLEKEADG